MLEKGDTEVDDEEDALREGFGLREETLEGKLLAETETDIIGEPVSRGLVGLPLTDAVPLGDVDTTHANAAHIIIRKFISIRDLNRYEP